MIELHRLDYLIYPENRWGEVSFVSDDVLITDLVYCSGFPAVASPDGHWREDFNFQLRLHGKFVLWLLCETVEKCLQLRQDIEQAGDALFLDYQLIPMPSVWERDFRTIVPRAMKIMMSAELREQEIQSGRPGPQINLGKYRERLQRASDRYG